MGWPEAIRDVAIMALFVALWATIITERYPWQRK